MAENTIASFWVKCGLCGKVWEVCDLPIPISALARLAKKSQCPECGAGSRDQFTATAEEIANVTASQDR